ncbi:MAG: AAA family ATPase [Alphaproteobacteria bacterium]|nr:AAA family ATPase [Alphaproteobacteria bacterium]
MPKIRSVHIENFRSIKKIDIECKDLTVFVGQNDCGKSNILRALNLFFNGETDNGYKLNFDIDFNKNLKKRTKKIVVELILELPKNYHDTNGSHIKWTKIWYKNKPMDDEYHGYRDFDTNRPKKVDIKAKSNVHALLSRINFEYIPAIRSPEYFGQLRSRIYKAIAQSAEKDFRDKSKKLEGAITDNVKTLIDDVKEILQEDTSLMLPNDMSTVFEKLDFLSKDLSISLNNRGDGVKGQYIPLILKFIADKQRLIYGRGSQPHTFIWAYEEPENNLEFQKASYLAKIFYKLATEDLTQILLTTHSPIFYNLANAYIDECTTHHILLPADTKAGTDVVLASKESVLMDDRMGVMEIVAPHLKKAQDELDFLKSQIEDYERVRKPTLFVEGKCEFEIISHLLKKFEPELFTKINIAEPIPRAGAPYVSNCLIAWEHFQKTITKDDRLRAAGIVDLDVEGTKAIERFKKIIPSSKHTAIFSLQKPDHLRNIFHSGFEIPVCLEEMWPYSFWQEAEDNEWLVERREQRNISGDLLSRVLGGDISNLGGQLSSEDLIFWNKKICDDKKTAWVDVIKKKPKSSLQSAGKDLLDQVKAAIGDII